MRAGVRSAAAEVVLPRSFPRPRRPRAPPDRRGPGTRPRSSGHGALGRGRQVDHRSQSPGFAIRPHLAAGFRPPQLAMRRYRRAGAWVGMAAGTLPGAAGWPGKSGTGPPEVVAGRGTPAQIGSRCRPVDRRLIVFRVLPEEAAPESNRLAVALLSSRGRQVVVEVTQLVLAAGQGAGVTGQGGVVGHQLRQQLDRLLEALPASPGRPVICRGSPGCGGCLQGAGVLGDRGCCRPPAGPESAAPLDGSVRLATGVWPGRPVQVVVAVGQLAGGTRHGGCRPQPGQQLPASWCSAPPLSPGRCSDRIPSCRAGGQGRWRIRDGGVVGTSRPGSARL